MKSKLYTTHSQDDPRNKHYHPVFNLLTRDELSELLRFQTYIFYKKGQYIFLENSMPHYLFCVHSGKIKIFNTNSYDGKEQILHLVKDGDVLASMELITNKRSSCSAVALEDSYLYCIDKQFFLGLLKKNTNFLLEIMRRMSNTLDAAENRIISMSQKTVRERVAEALILFRDTYGVANDGQTLNVLFTRDEIANYVGASTEATIRLLAEFRQSKLIELNQKKIKILDAGKLVNIAKLDFKDKEKE